VCVRCTVWGAPGARAQRASPTPSLTSRATRRAQRNCARCSRAPTSRSLIGYRRWETAATAAARRAGILGNAMGAADEGVGVEGGEVDSGGGVVAEADGESGRVGGGLSWVRKRVVTSACPHRSLLAVLVRRRGTDARSSLCLFTDAVRALASLCVKSPSFRVVQEVECPVPIWYCFSTRGAVVLPPAVSAWLGKGGAQGWVTVIPRGRAPKTKRPLNGPCLIVVFNKECSSRSRECSSRS